MVALLLLEEDGTSLSVKFKATLNVFFLCSRTSKELSNGRIAASFTQAEERCQAHPR